MNITTVSKLFTNNKLLFQVFLLIILNYLITKHLYDVLPSEALYSQSSIFLNLYKYTTFSLLLFIVAPILLYKLKWEDLIDKKFITIKYFVLFIFSIYAWNVITLDYNLHFNQAYNLDRTILLILFLLAFRLPLAFVYFVILSLVFYNQVSYPAFDCKFPDVYVYIKPLLEISILFIIFMFLKRVYKELSILAFFIVVICFHASNYFIPGLGKIRISENYMDWIWVNDLGNILMAKYSQGWLTELVSIDTIQVIVGWISMFTAPMQLFAFSIQVLVLFIFINKRFAITLLIGFELLHLGIFMTTGIFFWKWILLNLAIIYVIQSLDSHDIKRIFNYKIMLLSIPFILLGYGVFNSYWLAWYDTPLNNYNKIYAKTDNGQRYEIDINLFTPYDRVFYRNTLNCFIDKPIKSRWDTIDQEIMQKTTNISNKETSSLKKEIFNFEQKYGQNEFNKLEQERYKAFLTTYFKNFNDHKNKKLIWNYFSPVRDMYRSFNWDAPLNDDSKIKEIEIIFYKKFYDHKHNKLISLEEESMVKIKID